MSVGPLNRLTGTVGLVALAPTALLSATGSLTAGDTAVRAGVTFAAVVAVRRVARWYLAATAGALERRSSTGEPTAAAATPPASATGERRAPRGEGLATPARPQAPRRRRSDAGG